MLHDGEGHWTHAVLQYRPQPDDSVEEGKKALLGRYLYRINLILHAHPTYNFDDLMMLGVKYMYNYITIALNRAIDQVDLHRPSVVMNKMAIISKFQFTKNNSI